MKCLEPTLSSLSKGMKYLNVLARNHVDLGVDLNKKVGQCLNLLPLGGPQVRPRCPSGGVDGNRGERSGRRGRRIPAAPVVIARTCSNHGTTAAGSRGTSTAAKRAEGVLLLLVILLLLPRMVRRCQVVGRGSRGHKCRIRTMRQAGRHKGRQGERGGGDPQDEAAGGCCCCRGRRRHDLAVLICVVLRKVEIESVNRTRAATDDYA